MSAPTYEIRPAYKQRCDVPRHTEYAATSRLTGGFNFE